MNVVAKIVRIDNGWLLIPPSEVEEGADVVLAFTYSDDGNHLVVAGHEAEAFNGLLWGLIDACGVRGSKYDAWRVRSVLERGDAYEGESHDE